MGEESRKRSKTIRSGLGQAESGYRQKQKVDKGSVAFKTIVSGICHAFSKRPSRIRIPRLYRTENGNTVGC